MKATLLLFVKVLDLGFLSVLMTLSLMVLMSP